MIKPSHITKEVLKLIQNSDERESKIGTVYNNLCDAHDCLKNNSKALEYGELAIKADVAFWGLNHDIVARILAIWVKPIEVRKGLRRLYIVFKRV